MSIPKVASLSTEPRSLWKTVEQAVKRLPAWINEEPRKAASLETAGEGIQKGNPR